MNTTVESTTDGLCLWRQAHLAILNDFVHVSPRVSWERVLNCSRPHFGGEDIYRSRRLAAFTTPGDAPGVLLMAKALIGSERKVRRFLILSRSKQPSIVICGCPSSWSRGGATRWPQPAVPVEQGKRKNRVRRLRRRTSNSRCRSAARRGAHRHDSRTLTKGRTRQPWRTALPCSTTAPQPHHETTARRHYGGATHSFDVLVTIPATTRLLPPGCR